jgi:hypothetical protein
MAARIQASLAEHHGNVDGRRSRAEERRGSAADGPRWDGPRTLGRRLVGVPAPAPKRMALSPALQGVQRLALDTVALIYAFERHPVHFVQIAPVIAAIDAGALRGVVSSLALLETLVGPIQSGNAALAETYRRALTLAPNLELVPVDDAVAELPATIREAKGLGGAATKDQERPRTSHEEPPRPWRPLRLTSGPS